MKVKNFIKIFTLLMAILIIGSICNLNVVEATITDEQIATLEGLIPDQIELDIPELEFKQTDTLVEKQISTVLTNNGIDMTGINVSCNIVGTEDFYNRIITISEEGKTGELLSKQVSIVYNNTNQVLPENRQDAKVESYIETLKEATSKEIFLDDEFGLNVEKFNNKQYDSTFEEKINKYYNDMINDNSIAIIENTVTGGSNTLLNYYIGYTLVIFKDGLYYGTVGSSTSAYTVPVIEVGENLSEEEAKQDALNQIYAFYDSLATNGYNITIPDISEAKSIANNDIYNVVIDDQEAAWIIIKEAKTTTNNTEDTTTITDTENQTDLTVANDTTVATGKLPNTGLGIGIIISIVVLASGTVVLYRKYKKIEY